MEIFTSPSSKSLGKLSQVDCESYFLVSLTHFFSSFFTSSIQFSTGSVIILLATLIPIGALALNPSILGGVSLASTPTAPITDSDSFDERKIKDDEEKIVETEQHKVVA